jgi:hypothetical protein
LRSRTAFVNRELSIFNRWQVLIKVKGFDGERVQSMHDGNKH